MTEPWRILIVDDEEDLAPLIAASIRAAASNDFGNEPDVKIESVFDAAVERLAAEKYDLVILDVRDQPGATHGQEDQPSYPGTSVFERIRQHRFIPIIFYTAVPAEVQSHDNPPFVQVVSKIAEDHVGELRSAVRQAFQSDFPRIYRLLEDHSASVMRDFMIEFVEKNWDALSENRADMMHLLVRHLSTSLGDGGADMTAELGYGSGDESDDTVHPTRYYAALPSIDYATGDILHCSQSGSTSSDETETESWYVVVTPSCDFVSRKGKRHSEYVVLLECRLLSSFPEYENLVADRPVDSDQTTKRQRLRNLLDSRPYKQQVDRFHYLPEAWMVPDLIVDNQLVVSIPYDDLDEHYEKVASLDSPFAEELVHRFARYIGRLGTPDLDLDAIVARCVGQQHPP
ncbi:MAG: hypothetical protein OXE75_12085 [bacterium]|nr:hypothetical protein [bacterium]